MIGYKNIPDYWKQGLGDVEPINFKYTTISLNDAYNMSYGQALDMIKKNGGKVDEKNVKIPKKNHRQQHGQQGIRPAENDLQRCIHRIWLGRQKH